MPFFDLAIRGAGHQAQAIERGRQAGHLVRVSNEFGLRINQGRREIVDLLVQLRLIDLAVFTSRKQIHLGRIDRQRVYWRLEDHGHQQLAGEHAVQFAAGVQRTGHASAGSQKIAAVHIGHLALVVGPRVSRLVHTFGQTLQNAIRVLVEDLAELPNQTVAVLSGAHKVVAVFGAFQADDRLVVPLQGGDQISVGQLVAREQLSAKSVCLPKIKLANLPNKQFGADRGQQIVRARRDRQRIDDARTNDGLVKRISLAQMPNVDPGLVLLGRDQILVLVRDGHTIAIRYSAILVRGQNRAGLQIERTQSVRLVL